MTKLLKDADELHLLASRYATNEMEDWLIRTNKEMSKSKYQAFWLTKYEGFCDGYLARARREK